MTRNLILITFLLLIASCGQTRKVTVIVRMMPEQERFFKEKILPPFEKKNRCRVVVESFDSPLSIDTMISARKNKVVLVKMPFEATRHNVETALFATLDSVVSAKRLAELQDKYFLMPLAASNDKLYYLPRKFETRILIYLKSRVNDARRAWGEYREEIDSVLKTYNGYGLPGGYTLESEPDEWDYFDIFVVGWYWARSEKDNFLPRIAHRSKRYSGTSQRIVDRAVSLGGTRENIVSMKGDAVCEAFFWEALYARESIYSPGMLLKEGWSGADIWKGFKSGEVYLAFMTQLDAFFIHGDDAGTQAGYINEPDDLGFSVMPKGISVEINPDGTPLIKGTNAVTTGGWWWGIPKDSPDKELSINLAEWILSSQMQAEEATQFGMIPVRKDILGDISLLFGRTWVADVYNTSLKQLVFNKYNTIPLHRKYSEIEALYLDAFEDIVMKGSSGPNNEGMLSFVRKRLEKYQAQAQTIKE